LLQQNPRSVSILNVSGQDYNFQDPAHRIHQHVPLNPLDLLASILGACRRDR